MIDPASATKDGAKVAGDLRHAIVTMVNDDMTLAGTEAKARFIARIDAMYAAADWIEGKRDDAEISADAAP